MESWLPWLTAEGRLLVDLLPDGAKVLLVEPRRMRERAVELAEEEADLAGALAVTWGAQGRDFPRLYLPFDRLLSGTGAAVAVLPVDDGDDGVEPGGGGDGAADGPAARPQR
jgi:transcription-repair coupling factor (superfamily II helicase)